MLFISLFCRDDLQLRLSDGFPGSPSSSLLTLPSCLSGWPAQPPPSLPACLVQPGAQDSNLPIFDFLTKWAERGRAEPDSDLRLTVDYDQNTPRLGETNVGKLKLDLLFCHFLHSTVIIAYHL